MSDKASAFDEKAVQDSRSIKPDVRDVFGDEDDAAIKYKTMTWQVCVCKLLQTFKQSDINGIPS